MNQQTLCTAFEGYRLVASGPLRQVAVAVKEVVDRGELAPVLIFDDATSRLVELDLRGTADAVVQRLAPGPCAEAEAPASGGTAPRGPGRPKLGVVAREVTLLPRHWSWLATQPGGASVALRKLVEEARRANAGKDRLRQAQEACYRFLAALAGNQAGFEAATRALFAGDAGRFAALVEPWPADVRAHAGKLAGAAFAAASEGPAGARQVAPAPV